MIRLISTEDVRLVRHNVLRKGRSFNTSFFNGDDLRSTFHFGHFYNDELVSVVTLVKNTPPKLIQEKFLNTYQIRGMATLEGFQGKGLGAKLLFFAEEHLKSINCRLVWCNARTRAIPFYKKEEYKVIGEAFQIHNVGEHYIMFKLL